MNRRAFKYRMDAVHASRAQGLAMSSTHAPRCARCDSASSACIHARSQHRSTDINSVSALRAADESASTSSRNAAVVDPQASVTADHFSRRSFLAASALLAASLQPRDAEAAEGDVTFLEPESSVIGRFVEQPGGWQRFETLDFQLDVPPGFRFVETPRQAAPPGRGRAAPPSAIKATFVDSEDRSVTVVEYAASKIKPTFFQVIDIGQFGSVTDVAKLLTPPGARILSTLKAQVEQPERDTGTVAGKVRVSPQTIYRFEYQLGSGMHIATAAVARAGKVLLAGGIAPNDQWNSQPGTLNRVVESFQLTFPN